MAMTAEESDKNEEMARADEVEDDDEHDCKDRVLQKYFLLEWTTVNSLLSHRGVSNLSSVHKIRSIVSLSLPSLCISHSPVN